MSFNIPQLFGQLGNLFGTINQVNTARTAITTRYNTIFSEYESINPEVFDGYLNTFTSFQNSQSGFLSQIKQLAAATVVNLVNTYAPLPNSSLNSAMTFVIQQMIAQSATVQNYAVGNSLAYTQTGNAIIAVSTVDNNGFPLYQQYAETITFTCNSLRVVGNESWTGSGQQADTNGLLDFNFPQGSGSSVGLTAISSQAKSGNLLGINGGFETWVGSSPVGWLNSDASLITQGVTIYQGIASAKFIGDDTSFLSLSYNLSSLSTSTIYSVNCWIQQTNVPTVGFLTITLCDQTGAILDNNAGIQNKILVDLTTTASGSWINVHGFLSTPTNVPPGYRLVVATQALSSGTSVLVDSVSMGTPSRLGSVGPYMSVFSGNVANIIGDSAVVTTTNSGSPSGSVQRMMYRMGLISATTPLPAANSPTILDTVIS